MINLHKIYKKWNNVPGKDLIVVVVSSVIGFVLFGYVVQPVLVSINPMFSFSYGESYGRRPTTPAGIALWATIGVILAIYYIFEYKIEVYLDM